MESMTGNLVRSRFLDYFAARGHQKVHSSSLVPANDPTLLFTNAGMNQFKDVFLGQEKRGYQRATSAQKCVRAGGKHNDLENVGFTNRHHTFFEMLGNFSFGDYFKEEAIAYAWELVTDPQGYGIEPVRLYATTFRDDEPAYDLWRKKIGLPANRVFRLGEKDNFWAMGETGPCGPCSELHVDLGPEANEAGHRDCTFPCECGRYVEIWNLVFMQFDRDANGRLTPLPQPSIDTGAGVERLAAVLQGKRSNFETDLFQPLIAAAGKLAGTRYGDSAAGDVSLRIIADHGRAATFLIGDGVLPANEGRGYVLRKILRRAIRHGKLLNIQPAFLFRLAEVVTTEMAGAYPELRPQLARTVEVIRGEEERFTHTLELALKELDRTPLELTGGGRATLAEARQSPAAGAAAQAPLLAGASMFKLYDTYGLPLDLLQEIAREHRFELDLAGFEAEMEAQRKRARASWKGGGKAAAPPVYQELLAQGKTRFTGYESLYERHARLLALVREGEKIEELAPGQRAEAVLDTTPFYASSGGQIGDRGIWINAEGAAAEVVDTYAPIAGLIAHKIVARQALRPGDVFEAAVDEPRRSATRRNHTATHLLHAALRQVLGPHVKQAGSVVEPDRLRFDFTHYTSLSQAELEEVERLVNEEILKNEAVKTEILPLEQALSTGATALFGEKYQDKVRVVTVPGFSKELCGGTHCRQTGDIGLCRIASEGGIAAGVRRLEAITGLRAWRQYRQADERLHRLCELLRSTEPELIATVERLLSEQQQRQRELEEARLKTAQEQGRSQLSERQRQVKDVQVLAVRMDRLDRPQLRQMLDELRRKLGSGVVALGSAQDGKTALLVGVTADLTERLPAGKLIRRLPGISGGGRPDLAEAGGREPEKLDALLEAVYQAVEESL